MVDSTEKLSPEVLAACFRFLGFRHLITASHVSRFWRSTALVFPDLWAYISLDGPLWNSSNLVHMAMSRAGRHAVDFEYLAGAHFPERMAHAISQHIHGFSSFRCSYSLEGMDTCRSAPLLREFVCDGLFFEVPPDFLGGSTGTVSLRRLLLRQAAFPPECRALSSVTHLRATFLTSGWDPNWHPGFRYIFQLCPRLEILHLSALVGNPGVELPAGPAPRTLREVVLRSETTGCNLAGLYTAWALEAVPDVELEIPINSDSNGNIKPFFDEATAISVAFEGEDWEDESGARIVAQLPDARRRSFVCGELTLLRDPYTALADTLHAPQLHALSIPLRLLAVAAPRHRWPRLAHLSVHIHDRMMFLWTLWQSTDVPPRFTWSSLECLRALPMLDTLELHVWVPRAADAPTMEDARELKAQLAPLRDCVPREVHVHGFPADVARGMLVWFNDEPRVVFH